MQPGLLVAATVALHENSKMELEEADIFFKVGHVFASIFFIVTLLRERKAASVASSLTFQHFFKKRKMRVGDILVMIDSYRVRNWTF